MRSKEFKLALQDYHAAVTLSPQNALYYFNRGMTLVKLGAMDVARADFAKAVQLDPQFKERIQRAGVKQAPEPKQPGTGLKKGKNP